MQVSTILRDFASYYTFSLAVANDADNARMNRVCEEITTRGIYQI